VGDFDAALNFNNKALSVIDDKKIPPEFQSRILHTIILVTPLFKFKTISKQDSFQKGLQQNNLSTISLRHTTR
jgi:hypothetical protein